MAVIAHGEPLPRAVVGPDYSRAFRKHLAAPHEESSQPWAFPRWLRLLARLAGLEHRLYRRPDPTLIAELEYDLGLEPRPTAGGALWLYLAQSFHAEAASSNGQ